MGTHIGLPVRTPLTPEIPLSVFLFSKTPPHYSLSFVPKIHSSTPWDKNFTPPAGSRCGLPALTHPNHQHEAKTLGTRSIA